MDQAHLHLLLNHIPIIGTIFGIGFMAFGYLRKNQTITNAAKVVLIIVALLTIPTFFTGEPAEEILEKVVPDISGSMIHAHAEAAEFAFVAMLLLGALSLFSLWKKRAVRIYDLIILIFSIIVFIMMARVGNLGGQIQHKEIRGNSLLVSEGKTSSVLTDKHSTLTMIQ